MSNAVVRLVYFDRFALGAIVGVQQRWILTAPYESLTRLLWWR